MISWLLVTKNSILRKQTSRITEAKWLPRSTRIVSHGILKASYKLLCTCTYHQLVPSYWCECTVTNYCVHVLTTSWSPAIGVSALPSGLGALGSAGGATIDKWQVPSNRPAYTVLFSLKQIQNLLNIRIC